MFLHLYGLCSHLVGFSGCRPGHNFYKFDCLEIALFGFDLQQGMAGKAFYLAFVIIITVIQVY
jgi:hypothetical protein